jgi:hypothetical protein
MIPMRNCLLIPLLSVLIAGTAAHAQFKSVELSAKDIITLYNVPLEEKPAHKFEWTVAGEKYFRVVIEESDPKKPSWEIRESSAFGMPMHKFVLTCLLENPTIVKRDVASHPTGAWLVRTWSGGESKTQSAWREADFFLPAPILGSTASFNGSDSSQVFSLSAPNIQYRLRLEASAAPFAK